MRPLNTASSPLGQALPQDSARRHVTGQADYCDDLPEPADCLHGVPVLGPPVKAKIDQINWANVLAYPGVIAVITAADIPGENNAGGVVHDEPILPKEATGYAEQPIGLVVARTRLAARRAAKRVSIDYTAEPGDSAETVLEAIQTEIEAAIAAGTHESITLSVVDDTMTITAEDG